MGRAPRYAQKVDSNQKEIVDALEAIGCDVWILGRPLDLLVGYHKRNFLIEIKVPGARPDPRQQAQRDFIKNWRGQARQLDTPEEAIRLVTRAY